MEIDPSSYRYYNNPLYYIKKGKLYGEEKSVITIIKAILSKFLTSFVGDYDVGHIDREAREVLEIGLRYLQGDEDKDRSPLEQKQYERAGELLSDFHAIRRFGRKKKYRVTSVIEVLRRTRLFLQSGDVGARVVHDALEQSAKKANALIVLGAKVGSREELEEVEEIEETPLIHAIRFGKKRVVEVLLRHGADPNAVEAATNSTALEIACRLQKSSIIAVLLEHHADVNRRYRRPGIRGETVREWTPLHEACYQNDAETVEILLQHRADYNAFDENHQTPSFYGNEDCKNLIEERRGHR